MSPSGLCRLDSGAPAGEELTGHPRTPAHPRRAWRTGSRVASGRSEPEGREESRSAPRSPRARAAERQRSKGRETRTERSPHPSWGHSPRGPELTRSSPHQAPPGLPPTTPHLPKDPCCRVLSFRSQDETFRFLFTRLLQAPRWGPHKKRRGLVGKGFCGLTRA